MRIFHERAILTRPEFWGLHAYLLFVHCCFGGDRLIYAWRSTHRYPPSPSFDPRDPDHFAAAASPVLRGTPAGQRN
eukprot:scaffold12406_cov56-Phaeocystis_antarctica.AAC.2